MTIKPTPQILARMLLPAGGLTIAAAGAKQNVALALGGFALIVAGLTAVVVYVLARAIRDTTEERRQLQTSRAEVEADWRKYFAARAYVDHEAERLCRLGAQMEQDNAALLASEREEMLADLADREAAIMQRGFDICLDLSDRNVVGDALRPRTDAKVISLPVGTIGSAAGQGTYSQS